MKILIELILKNMKKNKTRTIVTISGIVLSIVLIFCLGFGFSTIRRYRFDKIASEIGSYHVTYHQLSKEDYYLISKKSNVSKVRFIKKQGETKKQDINFLIYETNGLELSKISLKKGEYPTKEGQVLLPEYAQVLYGDIGTLIEINHSQYQICGFYTENSWNNQENKLYLYKDNPTGEGFYEYQVTFKNIENLKEQVLALGDSLELKFSLETKYHEQEEINQDLFILYGETEELSGVIDTLILVLSLSCLSFACILVIYNAFAISVNEQKRLYGMLSSIGLTPRKRFLMVFLEATIDALIAIPIGLLLSVGLTNGLIFILNYLLKDVSVIKYQFSCYPLFLFISFGFFIFIIYLAAFIPALDAKKISPIEMMKESDVIKRRKVRNSIFGIEASLAKKTHFRNKRKYQIVTLSIVLGIVLFLLTTSFSKLYYRKVKVEKDNSQPDIIFQIKANKEITEITDQIQQVIPKTAWIRQVMPVTLVDQNRKVIAVGLDDETFQAYQSQLNVNSDLPILLNWYLLKDEIKHETESGKVFEQIPETISLFYVEFPSRERKDFVNIKEFEMTTIPPQGYYLYNRKMATLFFKESALLSLIQQKNIEFTGNYEFQITTESFIKIDQAVKKISNQYPQKVLEYQNYALEIYNEKINIFIQKLIFYSVILFVMMISITSIMNTLKASMRLRKKEFAVLRSIGMSKYSFYKMLLYECLLIGVDAFIIGMIVVIFLLGLINLIFLQLPNFAGTGIVSPSILDIIIVIFMVFGSIIITMLFEAKKFEKTNIIDSIKEDSF